MGRPDDARKGLVTKADMSDLSGACLCGAIRYRVTSGVRRVVNCHCSLCRRMNGSAFSSYAVVPHKALELRDEQSLARYAVTERATKHYCITCGTPIFNLNRKYLGACMLYLGSIEGGDVYFPSLNVYCESMLSWVQEVGALEGFPAGPEPEA